MRSRLLPLALLAALILAACDNPSVNRTATLQGVISSDGGAPIAGATLSLVREDATTATATTTSDSDGAYAFNALPAGAYNLIATTTNLGAYRTGITLTTEQAATADLTLTPLGNVIGTAILEDTPTDSEGITLRLTGTTFTATTPENGNFTISGVPAGTYTLTAAAPGYATSTTTVTVESGIGTVLPATLELARERPYARFTISRDGARVTLDASTSSDSDGTITNYHWDLGDGYTRTGRQITYTYASQGIKTITLTVTDNDGLSNTAIQEVDVSVLSRTATTDPSAAVLDVGIVAGATLFVQIDAPTNPDRLLYLELDKDLMLEAHTDGQVFYSVDNRGFSLSPRLPGPASVAPQAVSTAVNCRGSCIILPSGGPNMLAIKNHTTEFMPVKVYAYTEAPADANEPNDSMWAATPLIDTESGAIETIGDQDHYAIQSYGILSFRSNSDLQLRGYFYDLDGNIDTSITLEPGSTVHVNGGIFVMIEAIGGEAAASAQSLYYLYLD